MEYLYVWLRTKSDRARLRKHSQSMHDYVPARPDQQQKYVNVGQEDVDVSAQAIDLLGRGDQDQKATGAERNRDYLADDELDEELVREIDLIGARNRSPERPSPSVPELPVPPRLEISKKLEIADCARRWQFE